MSHMLSVIGTGPSHWRLRGINSRRFSGASGKWDATSLGLERYTGRGSRLGRLR